MNKFDVVLMVWFGLLGACIGSFLNVVIHRLPHGKSLLKPASHCPVCKHKIRPWHNIPIIGWLMLRGRCHDCEAKISVRYPLVEAASGSWFFLCFAFVFLALPDDAAALGLRALTFASLLLLGASSLCVALIWQDRKKIPRSILWTALLSVLFVITTLYRIY